jgi:hypothetical protein
MASRYQCCYCSKTFPDYIKYKSHLRKKKHFKLNPKDTSFDEYYIVNYSQPCSILLRHPILLPALGSPETHWTSILRQQDPSYNEDSSSVASSTLSLSQQRVTDDFNDPDEPMMEPEQIHEAVACLVCDAKLPGTVETHFREVGLPPFFRTNHCETGFFSQLHGWDLVAMFGRVKVYEAVKLINYARTMV